MQESEVVIRDGELLDLITLNPIKSSPKKVVLQSVLHHLSLSYGIPISRFEIDWKYKSDSGMLKSDIVIYDSSANSKNVIGLIYCGKLPSLSEKSPITSIDEVGKIKQSFTNLITICEEIPSVKYLLATNSIDFDYMEKGENGRFGEVSGWNLENIHSGRVDFHVGKSTIQFSSSLRRCHNYLHGNAGLSKDIAFWQILTLINCKSYDEQSPIAERRFFTTPEELNSKKNIELKKRIQRLYKDLIKTKGNKNLPPIDIEPDTLAILVRELSRFILTDISGDITGVAFQELIGSSLRGDKGQYFTPRLVVDFMVEVIKPTSNEVVLDPACGTGGFLLSVLDYAKSKSSKSPILVGSDFDPMMTKAAETGLEMSGSASHILFNGNSLSNPSSSTSKIWKRYPLGSVNVILTNPPFGNAIPITDENILNQYRLAAKGGYKKVEKTKGLFNSQPPEILFIERCYQWLAPGGRMGIVLPAGLMSNPGDEHIRKYILDHFRVDGCIEIPIEAFQVEANVNIITCLLFLTKKKVEDKEIYSSFMAAANEIGFDRRGKTIFKKNQDGSFEYQKCLQNIQLISEEGIEKFEYFEMKKIVDNDIPTILQLIGENQ